MHTRYTDFTSLILSISRNISKIKNIEMSGLKLKGKQVQCLYNLYITGCASITTLAKICDEDKGALSRTISELIDDNLVYIESHIQKKYKNPIKLTEHGVGVAILISKKIDKIVNLCGENIDENERQSFYNTLSKISNNLQQYCNSAEEKK